MNLEDLDRFQSVSIDTRTLVPGDVFVALKGPDFDGHDFVSEAASKGAIAAIVEHEVSCSIPLIKNENTFYAFGELASLRRQEISIPVIALTGSCGKTTTKTMLASILAFCGDTLATEANLNNTIGVPLTLLRLTRNHEFAVIEMGANEIWEIDYSAKLTQPNIAIITNVAPVHLEGFGDLDNVAKVKGDILKYIMPNGVAVLNADDRYFDYWSSLVPDKKIISFGIENKADFSAHEIAIESHETTQFTLQTPVGERRITLSVLGYHNIMNALAAAAAAHITGASLDDIEQGLAQMIPVSGRLLKKIGKQDAVILDDSYNANPGSMLVAMQVLAAHKGEKMVVMGDMAELGSQAEHYHHEIGLRARELGIDKLHALGELTPTTVQAFGKGGQHWSDRNEMIAEIEKNLHSELAILIKGSKINRMWEVVRDLTKTEN